MYLFPYCQNFDSKIIGDIMVNETVDHGASMSRQTIRDCLKLYLKKKKKKKKKIQGIEGQA